MLTAAIITKISYLPPAEDFEDTGNILSFGSQVLCLQTNINYEYPMVLEALL